MARPAISARAENGQIVFLGTLPKDVLFPVLPGALCALSQDPDLWFPAHGNRAGAEQAKAVCAECPARQPCLEWALKYEREGVWGGTTPHERQKIRRDARSASAKAAAA